MPLFVTSALAPFKVTAPVNVRVEPTRIDFALVIVTGLAIEPDPLMFLEVPSKVSVPAPMIAPLSTRLPDTVRPLEPVSNVVPLFTVRSLDTVVVPPRALVLLPDVVRF